MIIVKNKISAANAIGIVFSEVKNIVFVTFCVRRDLDMAGRNLFISVIENRVEESRVVIRTLFISVNWLGEVAEK
jgi:hypothetical protein